MTVHPVIFQDRVRGALGGTIGGIGRGLHRMHVHPDAITAVGLLVVVGAAVLIGRGEIQWGAIVLILGLPLDALDGAVARAGNRTGKFGGVLDSTFDRAADALIYGGLAYYFAGEGERGNLVLSLAALTGAFLVSYVRARAGEAGLAVRVGIMDRLVRLILVLVALLVPPLLVPGLWLLAVGSWFTVGQRMWYVRGHIDRA